MRSYEIPCAIPCLPFYFPPLRMEETRITSAGSVEQWNDCESMLITVI